MKYEDCRHDCVYLVPSHQPNTVVFLMRMGTTCFYLFYSTKLPGLKRVKKHVLVKPNANLLLVKINTSILAKVVTIVCRKTH